MGQAMGAVDMLTTWFLDVGGEKKGLHTEKVHHSKDERRTGRTDREAVTDTDGLRNDPVPTQDWFARTKASNFHLLSEESN